MMICRFGDYTFPHPQTDGREIGNRSALQEVPGAGGAFDMLGDEAPKTAQQVTLQFLIEETTGPLVLAERDTMLAALQDGRQKLYWEMEDGTWRWAWAKCMQISMPRTKLTELALPVTVVFEVAEGVVYDRYSAGGPEWGAFEWGAGALWGTGVTVSFPFSGVSTDITVTNEGNADALAAITVSCSAVQTAQNVKVSRRVGGADAQWFQATRTIAASKALVVDCAAYSVEYDGADDYANFSFGTNQVEWLHLEPGDNTIRIVCANGGDAGTIEFDFYPTFH